jgi:predicted nucleotidyltransferase
MEEKIVEYLKSKYNPQAILLTGSRVSGKAVKESDWDIYVVTPEKHRGEFVEWNDELLDITFKELPEKVGILTNPYKPLWPVKILLDNTDGVLDKVLANTKAKYDEGPLRVYSEGCSDRLRQLQRGVHKVKKFENDVQIQFYYLTYGYYFLIRSWFEQHNVWPMPPADGLYYIQEHDKDFWNLLNKIMDSRGEELSDYIKLAVQKVESVNQDKNNSASS